MQNSSILPVQEEIARISQEIRSRRKRLRIRQEDLAELAGVSTRYLSEIEQGRANPSLETVLTILQVLGMELHVQVRPSV